MHSYSHVAIPAANDPGLHYKNKSDALMAALLDDPGETDDEAAARAESRAEQFRVDKIRSALREPGATAAQLIQAAADPNPIVRRAVITHPDCPPDLRLAALQDPDGQVRAEVVRIVASPADLPADILTDENWAVRAALGERADCPVPTVMELLHHDPDPEVRRRALAAGVLRRDVVRQLLREQPRADGATTATTASGRSPSFLIAVPHEHAREALTHRPGVDSSMLLWLTFHDPSPTVRSSAVRNPRVSTRLLRRAFRDPAPEPRAAAVLRVGFPAELVDAAADDASSLVRLAALSHSPLDPAIPARLSRDPQSSVRTKACSHDDCPPEALARGAKDSDVEVRRAAVANPSMPRSGLAAACRDQDLDIQLLAVQHPGVPPASAAFAAYRESKMVLAIKVKADDEGAGVRRRHAQRMNESAAGALVRAPWDELRPLALTQLPHELINRVIAEHLDNAATDHRITIRRLTAQHPAVRARHLATLSADPDPGIRAAASKRVLEIV